MPDDEIHGDDADDEFAALRRDYVNGLRTTVTAVSEALATHDPVALSTLAHQTRGAAGMYGYPELSETAALLEDAIHEGQDETLILELADEFIRGMQAITSAP
jgi:HPt (histidine-containing phosphotransfer) domain-containing protein